MVRTTDDPKDKAVTIRLNDADRKKLKELAKREGRDVSNYVRWLIRREAKKDGIE